MSELHEKRILVVDDEPLMVQLISSIFSTQGSIVKSALSGVEALKVYPKFDPDLILLDVLMPDEDGLEICRKLRADSVVPIILLTALGRGEDIVRGLDAGADDYVTKPFDREVLLARARAVLRRSLFDSATIEQTIFDDGYLIIDLNSRQVAVKEEPVKLSATEYNLLAFLYKNAERVCSFSEILANVWGEQYRYSAEYVHVYIWHLRQKLEPDPKQPIYLISEHSIGYLFRTKSEGLPSQ